MTPNVAWQGLFDSAWSVAVVLAVAPALLLVVAGLFHLMGRMGWRPIERRTVECPETHTEMRTLRDLSHEPDGIVDIVACSRFGRGAVTCDRACLGHGALTPSRAG